MLLLGVSQGSCLTAFPLVLNQCPQKCNHTISHYLLASVNPHSPHWTEKHLCNFSLHSSVSPLSCPSPAPKSHPTFPSHSMGASLGSLPASICQLHVYINTARLSFRREGSGKIIETCFQSSTACVYTVPVKSTNKKKPRQGESGHDLLSSEYSNNAHLLNGKSKSQNRVSFVARV